MSEGTGFIVGVILLVILLISGIGGCMAFGPQYNVYSQEMSGKAELARADQNRQILVTQAQAERDSAKLRAEAIEIMGRAAQDFPEYRQQEFMGAFGEALREGKIGQVIYVPTEANIPIMEAGKR
jgi:hypothetical protein